ncbi:MAG: hypothetical protein QW123_01130 [Desulfurococcaceae archaeon]
MLALVTVVNVIGHLYIYLIVYRYFKKTRFYKSLVKLHEQVKRAPQRVKTKSDLRKARKYRPYLKAFRRRLTRLLIFNTIFFILVYISIVTSTTYITIVYGSYLVETPVMIPLLTGISPDGKMYTHAFTIMLLALILTIYPITRETRIV